MTSKMLQLGNGPIIMWIMLGVTQSFHFSTLEEYYIGGLFLGPFNGVTDGSVLVFAFYLASGVFGNGFWASELPIPVYGPMRIGQTVAYVIIITQFLAVALK